MISPRSYDGAVMGGAWHKFRVFEPAWWELGRWARFVWLRLFHREVAVGRATIVVHVGRHAINVRVRTVQCVAGVTETLRAKH